MGTHIMTSRLSPPQFISSLPLALSLLCALSSCDEAADEDVLVLRSIDDSDQTDVDSCAVDEIKGGANINCPHCGNHWTQLKGGELAIFLTGEFGDEIVPLADTGEAWVFAGNHRGKIYFDMDPDKDGYKLLVYGSDSYDGTSEVPSYNSNIAVVRFVHDTTTVDLRLRYVSNEDCTFTTPDL